METLEQWSESGWKLWSKRWRSGGNVGVVVSGGAVVSVLMETLGGGSISAADQP